MGGPETTARPVWPQRGMCNQRLESKARHELCNTRLLSTIKPNSAMHAGHQCGRGPVSNWGIEADVDQFEVDGIFAAASCGITNSKSRTPLYVFAAPCAVT